MAEDLSNIILSTEPTVLAAGWGRTEGPLWHPEGYVTFVDLEGSRLLRWDSSGEVSVVRQDTGEGNGCTLDRQGNLIMCEGADHRQVTRMDSSGNVTIVADRWQGKRFNKPNDVISRSDGTLYFTDPELRLPVDQREIGFSGVYRVDPEGQLHLATDECEYPNGLAFSPDESVFYVSISRLDERCFQEEADGAVCAHRKIRVFDVAPDGALSNNRVFCDMTSADPGVPDGMKVDTLGRVFCVGSGGFWVIEPTGEVAGVVRTSEVTRNLAFGGPDNCTLYMTPGSSLWKMDVQTPGIGAF